MKPALTVVLCFVGAAAFGASTSPVPAAWSINAHEAEIRDIAFSPDEEFLASAGADDLIKVRRVENGERVLTYLAEYPTAVAFSPRTNLFVLAHFGSVIAWRMPGFTLAWTNNIGTMDLAFSPDGQYIAGCFSSEFGHAFVFRASDGTVVRPSIGARDYGYRTVAFTPDGSQLLAGFIGIRIFNTSNWMREREIFGGEGFVLSPEGRFVAEPGVTYGTRLAKYNFVTGALEHVFEGTNATYSIGYLDGGKQLAATTSGDEIRVWDANTGRLQYIFTGAGQARPIATSPPGYYFAYGTTSGTLTLAYAPPVIKRMRWETHGVYLDVVGGGPHVQVQHRSNLATGEWTDVGVPWRGSIPLFDAAPGFYRARNFSYDE